MDHHSNVCPNANYDNCIIYNFLLLDSYYLKKEDIKVETPQEKLKLGIEGVFNLGLIVGVIGAVLISGFWKPHISFEVYSGVHLELQNLTRDILLLI